MWYPGALVLVGNGLSIAANPDLQLERLTRNFLERHKEYRGLEQLLRELRISREEAEKDFEVVVGALEAAEGVIAAFMELAHTSPIEAVQTAGRTLEQAGVPDVIRTLFYAYCAEVLASIGELTRASVPDPVLRFGDWIRDIQASFRLVGLFTLNYDVLLERMLISDDILGMQELLTDYFSGIPERQQRLDLVKGQTALGKLFYPYDPPKARPVRLHHLHGCVTHFHDLDSGHVFKVDSREIRESKVYDRLAAGEPSRFLPAVILGAQKTRKVAEWPFEFAFESLRECLRSANLVAIAGYSFRDDAVNELLTMAAGTRPRRRWIVVDRRSGTDAEAFRAKAQGVIKGVELEWCLDGFEGDLPSVKARKTD